jgi:hypothetical protein
MYVDLDVFALAIGTMAFIWTFCAILLVADVCGVIAESEHK